MRRKSIRGTVVFESKGEKEEFERYAARNGYGSFSRMMKCEVRKNMKSEREPIEKSIEPVRDALDGLYKLIEENNDYLEIIRRQLAEQECNSEITKAAKEILQVLLRQEGTISELNGRFNYSQDVIDGAVSLLIDLGLLGTRRKSSKMQNNSRGNKNEKK